MMLLMEPRKAQITEKLRQGLEPVHLEVINESGQHNVPKGSETHFKVIAVAEVFEGLSRVQRQQKVYGLLKEEFQAGLHALSQYAYTPEEWKGQVPASPQCQGGGGR